MTGLTPWDTLQDGSDRDDLPPSRLSDILFVPFIIGVAAIIIAIITYWPWQVTP